MVTVSSAGAQQAYDYPFKNPYAATIIGTPNDYKASLPKDLWLSVVILDGMLENNIPGGTDHFNEFFDKAMNRFASFYQTHGALDFHDDFLYTIYNENDPADE